MKPRNEIYNTETARLELQRILSKLLVTKWWQFRKQRRITSEAKVFARRNNIKH